MSKNASVKIKATKGKHKKQPWTYTIDAPGRGPDETVRERFANRRNALRSALRKLGAWNNASGFGTPRMCVIKGRTYPIVIID